MIHVVAVIELMPENQAGFLEAFEQLTPVVRAEPGCIEYGAATDVASGIDGQPPIRGNVVTVIEKWDDVQALKDHLAAPHMQEFFGKMQPVMKDVKIHVLQPTS